MGLSSGNNSDRGNDKEQYIFLRFGKVKSPERYDEIQLSWVPVVISYSTGGSFSTEESASSVSYWSSHTTQLLEPLGIKLIPEFLKNTAIYIKPTTTESKTSVSASWNSNKLILALVRNLPVVTPQYGEQIKRLLKSPSIHSSKSQTESYIRPTFCIDFRTPMTADLLGTGSSSAYKIHESFVIKSLFPDPADFVPDSNKEFLPNPLRKSLFQGLIFVVWGDKQYSNLNPIITTAGGKCQLYKDDDITLEKLEEPTGEDHAAEKLATFLDQLANLQENRGISRIVPLQPEHQNKTLEKKMIGVMNAATRKQAMGTNTRSISGISGKKSVFQPIGLTNIAIAMRRVTTSEMLKPIELETLSPQVVKGVGEKNSENTWNTSVIELNTSPVMTKITNTKIKTEPKSQNLTYNLDGIIDDNYVLKKEKEEEDKNGKFSQLKKKVTNPFLTGKVSRSGTNFSQAFGSNRHGDGLISDYFGDMNSEKNKVSDTPPSIEGPKNISNKAPIPSKNKDLLDLWSLTPEKPPEADTKNDKKENPMDIWMQSPSVPPKLPSVHATSHTSKQMEHETNKEIVPIQGPETPGPNKRKVSELEKRDQFIQKLEEKNKESPLSAMTTTSRELTKRRKLNQEEKTSKVTSEVASENIPMKINDNNNEDQFLHSDKENHLAEDTAVAEPNLQMKNKVHKITFEAAVLDAKANLIQAIKTENEPLEIDIQEISKLKDLAIVEDSLEVIEPIKPIQVFKGQPSQPSQISKPQRQLRGKRQHQKSNNSSQQQPQHQSENEIIEFDELGSDIASKQQQSVWEGRPNFKAFKKITFDGTIHSELSHKKSLNIKNQQSTYAKSVIMTTAVEFIEVNPQELQIRDNMAFLTTNSDIRGKGSISRGNTTGMEGESVNGNPSNIDEDDGGEEESLFVGGSRYLIDEDDDDDNETEEEKANRLLVNEEFGGEEEEHNNDQYNNTKNIFSFSRNSSKENIGNISRSGTPEIFNGARRFGRKTVDQIDDHSKNGEAEYEEDENDDDDESFSSLQKKRQKRQRLSQSSKESGSDPKGNSQNSNFSSGTNSSRVSSFGISQVNFENGKTGSRELGGTGSKSTSSSSSSLSSLSSSSRTSSRNSFRTSKSAAKEIALPKFAQKRFNQNISGSTGSDEDSDEDEGSFKFSR